MLKQDAIQLFGGSAKLARALGISRSAVSQWGDKVPTGRDFQIELLTEGALKAACDERQLPSSQSAA